MPPIGSKPEEPLPGGRRQNQRWLRALRGVRPLLAAAVLIAAARSVEAGTLAAGGRAELDRMALAVAGIESSFGTDPAMWRPDPEGPQGPMQMSAAAARDAGGGDRFDAVENRVLGRTYLAELYRRYRDWPDAIAAYNWGPGNMDAWIRHGRPIYDMPAMVARYRFRVMQVALFGPAVLDVARLGFAHRQPRRSLADIRHPTPASIAVERLYGAILRLAAPEPR